MNIKSILSRYALLICFPIVGLSQPTKTLTEPSILPSMTFTIGDRDNDQTDFDHSETLNLVIADYTCEDGGEHPLLQGGGGQSTLVFLLGRQPQILEMPSKLQLMQKRFMFIISQTVKRAHC